MKVAFLHAGSTQDIAQIFVQSKFVAVCEGWQYVNGGSM